MYVYYAVVQRVVDGDTIDLLVDVGFRITVSDRFRLYGIDAPEPIGPEASEAGRAAKAWLVDRLPVGAVVQVHTVKPRDKYGRWLAWVIDEGGHNVNDALVAAGHATRREV